MILTRYATRVWRPLLVTLPLLVSLLSAQRPVVHVLSTLSEPVLCHTRLPEDHIVHTMSTSSRKRKIPAGPSLVDSSSEPAKKKRTTTQAKGKDVRRQEESIEWPDYFNSVGSIYHLVAALALSSRLCSCSR